MDVSVSTRFEAQIEQAIQTAIGPREEFVALHEPTFDGNEWDYVKECIDTGWVSPVGSYVDQFEEQIADFTGTEQAVAVNNGTAALEVGLRLVGVEEGDEVLVPALTFVATANAVSYLGAVPHFVDSEWHTLGMDPERMGNYLDDIAEVRSGECYNTETGRRIRAIVPMHTFGHPVDLDSLEEVCDQYHLEIVEDAAESLGSLYKEEHTGRHGRCSALSFNGNKTITTGGGGAIITDDQDLADRARHLTKVAKEDHRWEYNHDTVGYNYRLPNINAALGCAQLEQLPSYLENKRILASRYSEAFSTVQDVTFFEEPDFGRSNYWLNAILLADDREDRRDDVLARLNDADLMTRPAWKPMHRLPMYRDCPRMEVSVAESIYRRLINIPSSVFLGEKTDVER
ncbi:LegC family aminotransferase [Salinibacter altiplanensis]|uniref:LegC family aminotransferase n=1 Tax=Salinibacter altiplanensis TaxID=1803181 RepID=UPI000C9FB101|nr:LegC family aminotransferase [Salinibacter altiplanensis]